VREDGTLDDLVEEWLPSPPDYPRIAE
jgi:hypothetical protein